MDNTIEVKLRFSADQYAAIAKQAKLVKKSVEQFVHDTIIDAVEDQMNHREGTQRLNSEDTEFTHEQHIRHLAD